MIRINLLGAGPQTRGRATAFDLGRIVTVACSLMLVADVLLAGWWYRSLREESSRVDRELAEGQQGATRLQSLVGEVQRFEQQRARLQERVALIEQLRGGQSIPVRLLDHVSRSLPDLLWLTSMELGSSQVTIEGRGTTLIALSDFVGNLGGGDLLQKPIEIVNSQAVNSQPVNSQAVNSQVGPSTAGTQAAPSLIQFTVRARINPSSQPGP